MKEILTILLENKNFDHDTTKLVLKNLADMLANNPDLYAVFRHYVAGKNKKVIAKRSTERCKRKTT